MTRDDPAHTPPHDELLDRLVRSYQDDDRTNHIDATFLPNRARVIDFIEVMRCLLFPGFFDEQRITSDNLREHIAGRLRRADRLLYEQTRQALRYGLNQQHDDRRGDDCPDCDHEARRITNAFLDQVPELRRLLATDVQAAFDGDPAAKNTDEAIFCYPGIDAIFTQRMAHVLYRLDVPLLPRIMSEYAHNETGIDIHPGAVIGESLFIDHGTGVVVGETCTIGDRVKIYQGVTLGALSTKGGQDWRGVKRHPTIEDDATIYGGAIILGGQTVIGKGATIGGSVFITSSVPAGHTVTMKQPELSLRPPRRNKPASAALPADFDPGI